MEMSDRNGLNKELTHSINGCAFEVINELGSGFLESVYHEKALLQTLAGEGIFVESQKPVKVKFRGKTVGDFYVDLLIERQVLVEIKAVKALRPEHQAQIINYLKATGIDVGLLINFGNPKLEFKRFTRKKEQPDYPVYPVHPC